MRPITPTAELGRLPEHGRIRFGVRSGKAMKSISTWRFTSADRPALEVLASVYGGTVGDWSPWPDRRQQGPPQYEVITTSSELGVFLPPDSLSVSYELWSAAGLARRCDGVTCDVQGLSTPCVCHARQRMECKPHSRLNVIIPEVRFSGVWRMETKGWNAAHQLSEMERTLLALQEASRVPLRATLYLTAQSKMKGGQKLNWMEPRLRLEVSPVELLAGGGKVTAGIATPVRPALNRGGGGGGGGDDVVIEAEVVEDDVNMDEWAERIRARFPDDDLDQQAMAMAAEVVTQHPELQDDDRLLDGLCRLISPHIEHWGMVGPDEKQRIIKALVDIHTGLVRPVLEDGRLRLVRVRPDA